MNTTTQRAHAPQHRAAWIMAAFALLAMSHTAQAVETSAQGEVVLVEKRDGVTSVRTVEGHVHQRANVAWTAGSLRTALKDMPKGDVARGKNLHSDMFCASCHGVAGESLSPNWPAINGQRADYTYKMLLDYQSGLREEDGRAGLMNAVAALLSKQDMAD